MQKPDPQAAVSAINYIKEEILPAIPTQIDQLTSETVETLRDKIHVLIYYCLKKEFDPDVINRLSAMLEISQGLWELLDDNASAFAYLKEMYKIRWLDLGANLLGQYEEVTSGEETFRDVILQSIATLIGWKSDTVWVDLAKVDHITVPKIHAMRLRDELWRFIGESSPDGADVTLEKAKEIKEKMNLLFRFFAGDDTPPIGRVLLLSNVYLLLLGLNIGNVLINLEMHANKTEKDDKLQKDTTIDSKTQG